MLTVVNYTNAVNLLTSQEKFHICLGLERVAAVLELMGSPQDDCPVIHVAGTNGKGSVSCMLAGILSAAGYKVGLFTSPHIIKYTERIKICGEDIPESAFADLIFEISSLSKKHDIYLTEFEMLTVLAFKWFSRSGCDICVVETGLGGRLDSTNVIKKNVLSVITSISYDHVDRLGDTIEKIAYEKAGIIKSGCPVLISSQNKGYQVAAARAAEVGSFVLSPVQEADLKFLNGTNYAYINGKRYEFGLLGLWQKENLELVYAAVEYLRAKDYSISEDAFSRALRSVFWSCRFQYIKELNLIIDGAHNPDAARVLRESLDFYFPTESRRWVYAALKTKDYASIVQTLFKPGDEVYLYDFHYPNAASCQEIGKFINGDYKIIESQDVSGLFEQEGLTVLTGSFYMIGEYLNLNSSVKNIALAGNIY